MCDGPKETVLAAMCASMLPSKPGGQTALCYGGFRQAKPQIRYVVKGGIELLISLLLLLRHWVYVSENHVQRMRRWL